MSGDGIYHMARDLDEPIMEPTVPEGLNIIEWRMETKEEKAKYIKAYNAAFPENRGTLRAWSIYEIRYVDFPTT